MNHHSFRSLIGAGMACAALTVSAVAVAAPAGAADTGGTGARHHRVHLTDEQKQCMNDHGITRPVRTSPDTRSTRSNVIWSRWTSNPHTIDIRASSSSTLTRRS